MPELRQNLATKEWVIMASDRAVKPADLGRKRKKPAAPDRADNCSFCPGNEKASETIALAGSPTAWRVRVVRNPTPALVPDALRVEPMGTLYRRVPGEGLHEIIVESPSHRDRLADLGADHLNVLLAIYRRRFQTGADNMKIALSLLFKNEGAVGDGASAHPHSQFIGSSVVPSHIRHRMDEAEKHYQQNNECVFCRMIEEERIQGARMLADSERFVAFVLFAALSPFHIWILPKRHVASFEHTSDDELADLAETLGLVLRKLKKGLSDPDYSFMVQSTPQDRGTTKAFHWYLSLVVRLEQAAGFELATGMHVNPALPEDAARFLNSIAD